ncbi:MAG TPA: GDSL-type esterase/lipase family protein [Terriglobales bacterium]|nr:GDSL-type esterase/lipase family protein [Terriglobales bacterium]
MNQLRPRLFSTKPATTIAVVLLVLSTWLTSTLVRAQAEATEGGEATTPADRLGEAWWSARHRAILERIKADPSIGLVLIGDSITQDYEKADPPDEDFLPTWRQFYASRDALNLGFSGDTTSNVLWRLDNGEVDGINPKAVVILIGTNNTKLESAVETERGIDAIVKKSEEKLPDSKILLLGILPKEDDAGKVALINQYLANRYGTDEKVTFLDIGTIYYKNGKLNRDLFYDPKEYQSKALHPNTLGHRMMAEAIEPTLSRLIGDGSRQYLATLKQVNTAIIPVPRLEMDTYDWYQRHQAVLNLKKTIDPEVVLIGDSITHFWAGLPNDHPARGQKAWDQVFGGMHVLNLGFGWDRTQNVLWRLTHGEFEGLHPRSVIINIGTNNLVATENARDNTPEEIVQGILAICDDVHAESPLSRIIVMGIFPRGVTASSPFRDSITTINQLLARNLSQSKVATFLDIDSQLLDSNGTLPVSLMADGLHPTEQGYGIWARALLAAGVRN